ncbi:uncharacterized protein LY89DRAFT_713160 [Mollisia scopiformis]|uniref:Uncharacterized protein n=1 Tax=Mollisia scopiformis TaxID=149040 RepID=A0A194XVM1_MOLSC|nr:uncharacterized protein LY89DRAFT_713160 [Mollisia scopiformis]KUJ24278.1 hypothetical protein LY89DRAFT_713160 [Mollisia scopiformis]
MRSIAFVLVAATLANAAGTPCASINAASASWAASGATSTLYVKPSIALACLESVPLSSNLSSAFIDYITPHMQFQSTISYLKDPPKGWTLSGVDIYGGLAQIKSNLQSGAYANQWSFEKDLWTLVNILPHDFHFNLPLPLLEVFEFKSRTPLVSISSDGVSVPAVYFESDIGQYLSETIDWTPSPITQIEGQDVVAFLEQMSVTTDQFQDPDALWNRLFYNSPAALRDTFGQYYEGGWMFGFDNDTISYTFDNGSTASFYTYAAISPSVDFTYVTDGPSLFEVVEVAPNAPQKRKRDLESMKKRRRTKFARQSSTSSEMPGYPTPFIVHPEDPYTAGFFLDSGVAVLSMTAFEALNSSSTTDQANMQKTIAAFLAECKKVGSTQLIVDLSANGGGEVYSGYDVFKQLFPSIVPYGGSRMRTNPWVDYIGDVYSLAGIYNETFQPPWEIKAGLTDNLTAFTSFKDLAGPNRIYGDNFLTTTRANLSDLLTTTGFSVYGYGALPDIPPAVFEPSNIVMLLDGGCGSTCAIFAEFMKSQGGVRSVSVGGRLQTGPMQGVGGSKGAQEEPYLALEQYRDGIAAATPVIKSLPTIPAAAQIPPSVDSDTPLGSKDDLLLRARVNFRNNIRSGDTSQTPLQFVYEAANCRIYYEAEDLEDMSNLWNRVANVTWGGATCVNGSSSGSGGNLMGSDAMTTVAYDSSVNSKAVVPASPGLVAMGSGPGTGSDSSVATFNTVAKSSGAVMNVVGGSMGLLAVGAAFLLL